ncbi:unnamed protein product [Caenorhabditis angaria]|uniref:Uncharacterized protein n=1 Tax=Caenorhabditis angaria TaxID=860376 RepID=A0A9P1IWI1_9PELO|nr:unnamed protein product [Caenorhabditis angaria]
MYGYEEESRKKNQFRQESGILPNRDYLCYNFCVNVIQQAAVCQESVVFYEKIRLNVRSVESQRKMNWKQKLLIERRRKIRKRLQQCCILQMFCPSNLVDLAEYNQCLKSCDDVTPKQEHPQMKFMRNQQFVAEVEEPIDIHAPVSSSSSEQSVATSTLADNNDVTVAVATSTVQPISKVTSGYLVFILTRDVSIKKKSSMETAEFLKEMMICSNVLVDLASINDVLPKSAIQLEVEGSGCENGEEPQFSVHQQRTKTVLGQCFDVFINCSRINRIAACMIDEQFDSTINSFSSICGNSSTSAD